MKKNLLLTAMSFIFCKFVTAQVLCIYCYDQNDTISANVNNLILNGGFENNNCIPENWFSSSYCPNSAYYSCNIVNWTCTGGGYATYADIVDLGWGQVIEGTQSVYLGNHYCNACSAIPFDTSCINNILCASTGVPANYPTNQDSGYGGSTGISLSQTVNGLVTGNTYVLEFWAGGEIGHPTDGLFAVDVGFGDTLLRENETQPGAGIGTRFIVEFNATSSSHIIKFTNWGHICNTCTELILDDVRFYTLAELSPSVPHCTTGIDIPSLSEGPEYMVYPNPVTNELTVKTNSNELSEITLYDIASRKLMEESFINSFSLNTEQFSKGIYFYEGRNKNGKIKQGKIVKE